MKIQVILEGGLGNQMFQYSLGRSMSIHYGVELSLYTPHIYAHRVKRAYQLNYFDLYVKDTEELIENPIVLFENNSFIDELYNLNKGNYCLKGYWQDEKYFESNAGQIRRDFDLGIKPIEGRLLVQVRRGDYVNNPYHEYCNLDWYQEALSKMEYDEVYVVSDDILWCKENLNWIKKPITYIEGTELDSFKAMYSCDRFIISNSSFGWWGAWWTDSNNVICPKIWTPGNPSYDPARKTWKRL